MTSYTLKPYIHNGLEIAIPFTDQAFFNATIAAKQFGKLPKDWLKTDDTQAYVLAVRRKLLTEQNQLVKIVQGGSPTDQGTWLHPKLGIAFARWLNPDFAVWADEQIQDILTNRPGIPQSFSEALRLAAEQQERIEQQQREIEASRPKVMFHDQVVLSETLMDFAETFSLLQHHTGQRFTRRTFLDFCRRHAIACQPNFNSGVSQNRFVPRKDYIGTWFVSEMLGNGGTEWKVRPMAVAGIVRLIEIDRIRSPFQSGTDEEAA